MDFQQRGEGAGGSAAAAEWMHLQAGDPLVLGHPGVPHQAPKPEDATVLVDLDAALEEPGSAYESVISSCTSR